MPLRVRLIASISLVLLVALACGSVLVWWHAANSVRTELRAALDVGTKTIRNGIDELTRVEDREGELRHLVATFNGNRHVRAMLLDARDRPVATSELFHPTQPVPGWFRRLIAGSPDAVRIPVLPGDDRVNAVVLQSNPENEIGEVWGESRDAVLVLAGFAVLSAVLICAVVGRALRPLETLSLAFEQIGKGDYRRKVSAKGPPELMRLVSSFNDMTQRLVTVAAQNRRLNEQLLTLQAEERADLARDLHDEVGQLLFSIDMTVATIEQLVASHRWHDVPSHLRSIHDAVAQMQRHVRAILGRLRPIRAIGLEASIRRLVAFWQSRRPGIDILVDVSVEEVRIGDDLKETIYRIVQEGLSNAIRHGRPARVRIVIVDDQADGIRVEVTDDGIGMAADGVTGRDPTHLGLIGMRERVMAMAGSLSIQHDRDGKGLTLVARLPHVDALQSADADAPE
jgi:two-component system, NarL family, sensor histidine kinase UhpB